MKPGYYTAFDVEASALKVWCAPSLPSLPGILRTKLEVSIRVQTIGQIYLFENYLYLIVSYAKNKKSPLKKISKKSKIE